MTIRLVTDEKIAETSVRYHMERLQVHGRERTGCSSSLITVQIFRHYVHPADEYGSEPVWDTISSTKTNTKRYSKSLQPILEYYPQRDRGIIADRVEACILTRQKKL